MDHTIANTIPSRSERLPLPPQPSASLECLLGRLDCIYCLLRKRGFSDNAALAGRDAALGKGMEILETGQAEHMSASRRAGWLWTLARRAAGRAAKKEMATVRLTYDPPDYRLPAANHQNTLEIAVRRAIARLTEQQRAAVTLCIMQGLTRGEAARMMGIKVSTVCRHLQAAFVRLRKDLAVLKTGRIPGETPGGR